MTEVLVVGAAIIVDHRVLAARRTYPPRLAGYWELPGGKLETGETPDTAAVREVREELGCTIAVTGRLAGTYPIKPGCSLVVVLAELVDGEPVPGEHDVVRWLDADTLDTVAWLPPDLPVLPQLRRILSGR